MGDLSRRRREGTLSGTQLRSEGASILEVSRLAMKYDCACECRYLISIKPSGDNRSAPIYGLGVNYMLVTDTKYQEETIIFNG